MFPDLVIVCHSVGNLTGNNLKPDLVPESSHTDKRQKPTKMYIVNLENFVKKHLF